MKITEHLYKTSGVEYGTNSNTFLLESEDDLILFDLGFEDKQWKIMNENRSFWHLDEKKICAAFLTHGHYDHAGNAKKANEEGILIYAADPDAYKIENGYPEMEKLFEREWICARIDERIKDGQSFHFGSSKVTALSAPGHSKGSFAYVIETDGHKALCTGDMFYVKPLPPKDDIELELAYMGSEDFDMEDFIETLERMSKLHCDILLPGHYYVYYGNIDALCRKAAEMARALKEGE